MSLILPLIFNLFLFISCGQHSQWSSGTQGVSNTNEVKAEPLSAFVLEENIEALTSYVSRGGDLEVELETGRTLLTEACEWQKLKVIEFLLSKKVLVDKKDRNGKSAVDYAEENLNIKRVLFPELVLEQKKNLFQALVENNLNLLKKILEEQPPLNFTLKVNEIGESLGNFDGETILSYIVKNNLFNILRLIAAPKYQLDVNLPNERGELPLKISRELKYSNIEKLLLKLGAKDE